MTETSLRVLSLQPFYGGSHRQFNDHWVCNSRHRWTTIGLPDRHWKWRMRHACIYFAEQVQRALDDGENWDVIVCSDMLGLAEFKGLMPRAASQLPVVIYFHENQFSYPNRREGERDQHFAFTNFTSAVAADQVWFNSRYHGESMMNSLRQQANRWPDYVPNTAINSLAAKICVQSPGLEDPPLSVSEYQKRRRRRVSAGAPIRLLWAARWEHDKNPADLLATLIRLRQAGAEFRLSVIGQQFREMPIEFGQIREQFSGSILHWGYQESRADYWQVLSETDIFISTAQHEFFGIAAAEAISVGLFPLLPNRLAYPELIRSVTDDDPSLYLYDGSPAGLATRVLDLMQKRDSSPVWNTSMLADSMRSNFNWKNRAATMDEALAELMLLDQT